MLDTDLFVAITTNVKPLVRKDKIGTRDYLVAPAIILLEGVHNGNHGPLYYPWSEIEQTPAQWDHKPVVVYHPSQNTQTACTPEYLSTNGVGMLLNTQAKGRRLKTETWFDAEALARVDDRVEFAVNRQIVTEVSTGLFMNVEKTPGDWNGEAYVGVARNYRGDHLAVLPDQIGACSVRDGAGLMRMNAEGRKLALSSAWTEAYFPVLKAAGINVDALCVTNELGYDVIREQLHGLLKARMPKTDIWVIEVYQAYCVYESAHRLYKQAYDIAKDVVSLKGVAEEVVRIVQYKPKAGVIIGNHSAKEPQMTKKEAIDALVANGQCKEADRAELEKLADETLASLAEASEKSKATIAQNAAVQADAAGVLPPVPIVAAPVVQVTVKNAEQFINDAPVEVQRVLRYGLSTYNAQVEASVARIMKAPGCKFTAEQLKAKDISELQAIEALLPAPAQPVNNYRGQGDPAFASGEAVGPVLEIPVYNFDQPK